MKTEIKVGIAVFTALLLLGCLVSVSGDVFWRNNRGYLLEVTFNDVRGLGEGSYLLVSGVKAGKVTGITLSPDGVAVSVLIPEEIRIPADSRFLIATGGLLGESEIHVARGTSTESFQPGGKARGTLPPSFDQILFRVEEDLQEIRSTFKNINNILASPGVKDNLLRAFNDLPKLVSDTRETAVKISGAADSFSEMTKKGQAEITRLAENLNQASRTLSQTVQENRRPLNETLENLRSATSRLEKILAGFDSDNNAGTELRETISAVGRAARQLEEILRETRQAFSGEEAQNHPVSRFRDVIDKADHLLGKIEKIELDGQVALHQVTSDNGEDLLMDLSFLLHERGGDWSFQTGVEDLGEDEKFNALVGWRWNNFLELNGGIVRGDIGAGLNLDFREGIGIPVETSWLWWDDNGGQWKSDTFFKIQRDWGILYRHLHLEEENRDSLGLFYRF